MDDKPPSTNRNKNSIKLPLPCYGDLGSLIFECKPNRQGINNFRSLVWIGDYRRTRILETDKINH